MKAYRLTYYCPCGFTYDGFDSRKEALDFVSDKTKKGLITPLKLMKYNSKKDEYFVIGTFSKVSDPA